MKLDFEKRRSLELNLYGEKMMLTFPTAKEVNSYVQGIQKAFRGESKKNDYEVTLDFLIACGMKKKDAESMEMNVMEQVIEALTDQTKKN